MSTDRHAIWRQFKRKADVLTERAPEGYAPVGLVYLFGREEPLQLGLIETSGADGQTWTWLQAAGSVQGHDEEAKRMPHPDGEWIFVHEAHIARVEIRYVPKIEAPPPIEYREVEGEPEGPAEL